jgi:hypothetical protein
VLNQLHELHCVKQGDMPLSRLRAMTLLALSPCCIGIDGCGLHHAKVLMALTFRHVACCSTGRRVSLADLMSPKSAPIPMRSTPPAWGAAKGASPTNGLPSLRDIQVRSRAPPCEGNQKERKTREKLLVGRCRLGL